MKTRFSAVLCAALALSPLTPLVSGLSAPILAQNDAAARAGESVVTKVDDARSGTSGEPFAFVYTGVWHNESGYPNLFDGGTDCYSDTNGDYYEMKFIGSKIAVYGSLNPNHGSYSVEIDGQSVGTINANASSVTHKQKLFESETLEEGEHTIKVKLITQGKSIQVDWIEVTHAPIASSKISLSAAQISLAPGASSDAITVSTEPWYATADEIEWISSDPDLLSISADGVITAASGITDIQKATVTARLKNSPQVMATIQVSVKPAGMYEDSDYLRAYAGNEQVLDLSENAVSLFNNAHLSSSIEKTMWKNDEASAKLIVSAGFSNLNHVRVEASAFTDDIGNTLGSDAVSLHWLEEVSASVGRGNSNAPVKAFPDKIEAMRDVSMDKNSARFAWAQIRTDKDTRPGTYTGKFTITADELKAPIEIPCSIEVLNLEQPALESTELQIWQHPFSAANHELGLGANPSGGISNDVDNDYYFSDEHLALMADSMQQYKNAGGHDVVANIVQEAWGHQSYYSDPSMVTWTKKTDGSWEYDYTWYDKWIDFQIDQGVIDPVTNMGQIKCFSIVPWNNQLTWYDEATSSWKQQSFEVGSDAWTQMWTPFLHDFMEHSMEKGWFDITYISMDERSVADLTASVNLITSIKNEDGKAFKISSALNYPDPGNYSLTDRIDDISINQGNVTSVEAMRTLAEHRKALNLKTTVYNCTSDYPSNFMHNDPAGNNWVIWYACNLDVDGYMRWAWDNFVYDMHGNATYRYWEPGDGWFVYPPKRGSSDKSIISTPRFEMLKQGMRDVAKAKALLADASIDESLKQDLKDVIARFERPAKSFDYGSAVASNESDRQALVTLNEEARAAVMDLGRKVQNEPQTPALDFTTLEKISVEIPADLSAFSIQGQSELAEALEAVQNMLNDHTSVSSQSEINDAIMALHDAWLDLRLLPDADRLNDLNR